MGQRRSVFPQRREKANKEESQKSGSRRAFRDQMLYTMPRFCSPSRLRVQSFVEPGGIFVYHAKARRKKEFIFRREPCLFDFSFFA
jgi:hypothetical protein